MQIAIFLGDDRQEEWAQIAGTLLFGCLTTDLRTCGTPAHVVNLVESLGDDVHQKLLSAAPLDCILAHFSRASHARAIQLRTHCDDHGPHLTVEVSERFSTMHAEALMAVLKSVPPTMQHVSVTVRPSWHAARPGKSRPHPSLSTQASAAWGTPFVVPERWLSAVAAVAKALQVMPRLSHLFCNCCSLETAAAASLPLNSVATLHLQENDLGHSMGFLEADTRKPLFDTFVRRLVTHDVGRLIANTVIQVRLSPSHNTRRRNTCYHFSPVSEITRLQPFNPLLSSCGICSNLHMPIDLQRHHTRLHWHKPPLPQPPLPHPGKPPFNQV